jgi:hypothetical protein
MAGPTAFVLYNIYSTVGATLKMMYYVYTRTSLRLSKQGLYIIPPINIFIRFRITKRTVVWLKKADFIQSSTRQLIIWLAGVSSWSAEQMSLVCPCCTLLLRSSSSGASVKPAGLARRETSLFFADDLDLISFTACSLDANLEETGTHAS